MFPLCTITYNIMHEAFLIAYIVTNKAMHFHCFIINNDMLLTDGLRAIFTYNVFTSLTILRPS